MIDITHWYYPQIFVILWFAWRVFVNVRKNVTKDWRIKIRAESYSSRFLSDRVLTVTENLAACVALLVVYGPCLLFLLLGGFFS